MAITSELAELINCLNLELNQTEQQAINGLSLVRELLLRFSNNAILLQYYAFLSAAQLFAENSRRQIQAAIEFVLDSNISDEEIQNAGEELGTILGQTLEVKLRVEHIMNRLQE